MEIQDITDQIPKVNQVYQDLKTARSLVNTGATEGAVVSVATSLTVAATSGAGITSGLAAAGNIVGGGMAVGPVVLAAGPTYAGVALNQWNVV